MRVFCEGFLWGFFCEGFLWGFFSSTRESALRCSQDEIIDGSTTNGCNFAQGLCEKWGFDELEFFGTEEEYRHFINDRKIDVAENWLSICDPEFQIAGGSCKTENIDQVGIGNETEFCNFLFLVRFQLLKYPVTTASTTTTTTSATSEITRSRLTPDHAVNSIKERKCSNLNTNFDVPRIGVKEKFKVAYHQGAGISWHKYSYRTSYRKVTQNFHSG